MECRYIYLIALLVFIISLSVPGQYENKSCLLIEKSHFIFLYSSFSKYFKLPEFSVLSTIRTFLSNAPTPALGFSEQLALQLIASTASKIFYSSSKRELAIFCLWHSCHVLRLIDGDACQVWWEHPCRECRSSRPSHVIFETDKHFDLLPKNQLVVRLPPIKLRAEGGSVEFLYADVARAWHATPVCRWLQRQTSRALNPGPSLHHCLASVASILECQLLTALRLNWVSLFLLDNNFNSGRLNSFW